MGVAGPTDTAAELREPPGPEDDSEVVAPIVEPTQPTQILAARPQYWLQQAPLALT